MAKILNGLLAEPLATTLALQARKEVHPAKQNERDIWEFKVWGSEFKVQGLPFDRLRFRVQGWMETGLRETAEENIT